ncbi:isoleucine--tRNA ligase [Herpetosiphon giganteus]|uniref:isoleucine--tRNA ligase n=1 Tax=Herpetosiphon giganteus TaxID=2029754 RepID=UPI001958198F|nr:isoleucine--tRNA ligase [Herpetosiphon giganteus]MBM7842954.1 isoleucyl-tRNA synthetase [Herpetosiphon giganteus]
MAFAAVDPKVSFPTLEDEIAAWWEAHGIVKKTLAHGDASRPFVFFEGPPTANGRPGIHHVEARSSKDIMVRFNRMLGKKVIGARGGWDTHGLPVELEVEKKLGFAGKPDIEKYGITEFNAACRQSVWDYIQEWEKLTQRIAFWIDLEDPYITYDNKYIESLWWIFKQLHERELLYRDYKVTMHCPRCGTSLSDHEVAQGYQDNTDDPSVWIRFKHTPSNHALDAQVADAAFLAWTTTPWTLPANAGLAVNPEATYVLAEHEGQRYILAEALVGAVLGEGATTVASFTGADLQGLRYTPLFAGVGDNGATIDLSSAYRVVADEFVSLEDGTGIVHIAPAYGDLEIGRKYGLPTLFSVDLAGKVLSSFESLGFAGLFFKEADPKITRYLKEQGSLFKSGRVLHTYPFCWRCKTPLLFYAKQSWYIRTTALKQQLIDNNKKINWVPEHIQAGRFGNWLENNIDWAISRERYWGTPLPVWACDTCQHVDVVGSLAELGERWGQDTANLDMHRPFVDAPTWSCHSCETGTMQRIPDVADCWFDSGAMPVAQWHYPFENQELFEVAGQADFISEAIDQTRGWFYTLHAVSTLLFDRPAYKNVICLGHLLDGKGEKMSKSKGNIVSPWEMVEKYGADAVRWYMFAAGQPYNPRRFSADLVSESLRQFLLTLWNTYSFFTTYANVDGWTPEVAQGDLAAIDRWALARLNGLVRDVRNDLTNYDMNTPAKRLEQFVDELSNWYVRRNRRRFWGSEMNGDKQAAYSTLYTCLVTISKLMAPFTPFVAESLYQNLVRSYDQNAVESVHMALFPEADLSLIDDELIRKTDLLLKAVSLGRAARKNAGLRVRQPLSEVLVRLPRGEQLAELSAELSDELNIKSVRWLGVGDGLVSYRFKPNLRSVGKKFGKLVPALREVLAGLSSEQVADAAHKVETGASFEVEVEGQTLTLAADDVLMEASSPEGYAVAEGEGLLVALVTTLTDELLREGIAREIVRNLNDARKAADLAITDKINATLGSEVDLAAVVAEYGDYIKGETLCENLSVGDASANQHTSTMELEQGKLSLGISKVA